VILYLDSSAIVKRYLAEQGTDDVRRLFARASYLGTSLITRAEITAAFARAAKMGRLQQEAALAAAEAFGRDWIRFVRLGVTEKLIEAAGSLAWQFRLRGYHAVHLAAALEWRTRLGRQITLVTFDNELWAAAQQNELDVFPVDLQLLPKCCVPR